ncbi:VWA domain-containing protein [Bacillus sp. T3]|uniref:VWA domain-containing protein n=1 Tax=Bacillus sp. T3 TaxID=467262 RepID=UPI002980FFF9|nr:VWA domain-containing protein [Bacillus sp. T3]
MKPTKKLLLLLSVLFFALFSNNLNVFAADDLQMQVDLTTSNDSYNPDEEIKYDLKVTNPTVHKRTNIKVTTTLPEELEVLSSSAKQTANKLTWKIDSLDPKAENVLTFSVKLPKKAATATPTPPASESTDNGSKTDNTSNNNKDSKVTNDIDAPKTGDPTNFTLYISLLILSSIVLGISVWAIKKKQVKKSLTFLLIFALLSSSAPFIQAEEKKEEVTKTHTVTIQGKEYTITTEVEASYEIILQSGKWVKNPDTQALGWEASWEEIPNADSYNVYRGFAEDEFALIGENLQETNFVDEGFNLNGFTYYYVVAVENGVEGSRSNVTVIDGSKDTDKDSLSDTQEEYYGSNVKNTDTDDDGLPDGYEVKQTQTDPTKEDTDTNGTSDGDEDLDQDGLTNKKELELGTEPSKGDSDFDGLVDLEEVKLGTNALSPDTDEDGLEDGFERENGFNPLKKDTNDNGILDSDEVGEFTTEVPLIEKDDHVTPSVSITSKAIDAATTSITNLEGVDSFLSEEIPGYMGAGFDFTTEVEFDEAAMTFQYDESFNGQSIRPEIYYYNEEQQRLEKLENQVHDPNSRTVTATVTHFSKYILLNGVEWDKAWENEIVPPNYNNEGNLKKIDVVFSIDSSGSMDWEDPSDLRKTAAKSFVEKLTEEDRAAVVDFDYYATTLVNLTTDKDAVQYAIDTIDSSGGTDLYVGVKEAIDEIVANGDENNFRFVIFLTDGDGYWDDSAIDYANENNVTIYTIGLGANVQQSLLERIATETGGKYFFASSADKLDEIFDETAEETIDYVKDSDTDGIPDWYEINGLRLGNGVTVKTDYLVRDEDKDGLLDGEEIVPSNFIGDWAEGIYFKMISDPRQKDSDFDGAPDDEEKPDNRLVYNLSQKHKVLITDLSYVNVENWINLHKGKDVTELDGIDEKYDELVGWKVIDSENSHNLGFGFGAIALKKGKQVVISYRGSDGTSDWLFANRQILIENNNDQAEDAKEFTADIMLETKDKDVQVYLTGHSLGGFLTQAVAYDMYENKLSDVVFWKKNKEAIEKALNKKDYFQGATTYNSAFFLPERKSNAKKTAIPFSDIYKTKYDNVVYNYAMTGDMLYMAETFLYSDKPQTEGRMGSRTIFGKQYNYDITPLVDAIITGTNGDIKRELGNLSDEVKARHSLNNFYKYTTEMAKNEEEF